LLHAPPDVVLCGWQASGADSAGSAAAGAASSSENVEDPGKTTYNLLLKNELLGAGVNRMQVTRAAARTTLQTHTANVRAHVRVLLSLSLPLSLTRTLAIVAT